MKRPDRSRDPRRLRRDWAGDAVLTLVAGGALVAAVFLPWANDDGPGRVNYSLSQGSELNGVLDTAWGTPALAVAAVVVAAGLAMLLTRPHRFSILLGVLVAACGVAAFGVAQDAAASIGFFDPGVGMYLTTLVAVLLVPIGLAAALVAWLTVRGGPDSAVSPAATPPPARETAPPS